MVVIGISVTIMAITLVVLACFMIPAFVEIRKTAAASREFLACVEKDIKPVLQNLQDTLTDLKIITEEASSKIEDVGLFMEELGNAGRTMRTVNSVVGGVTGLMGKTSLWMTGAKVAGKILVDQIIKKRG
ncbi:hypothetical protein Geob_0829 [Geotalea daltonii FRC-32]|uniref:DUF948 domain-containing protein n=1 Tax=Geotalea daltonii (strain DSM 22248 / JCM 15807 / FRC-32) TaxID=316067 RepID=B9M1P5_GEODF|nr:DUF948 domain-containing protein [Geotalea daltonii]ACM19191.1 hypothetical protein Geob_0829 [Geotalea daltonii FRC-32]